MRLAEDDLDRIPGDQNFFVRRDCVREQLRVIGRNLTFTSNSRLILLAVNAEPSSVPTVADARPNFRSVLPDATSKDDRAAPPIAAR